MFCYVSYRNISSPFDTIQKRKRQVLLQNVMNYSMEKNINPKSEYLSAKRTEQHAKYELKMPKYSNLNIVFL